MAIVLCIMTVSLVFSDDTDQSKRRDVLRFGLESEITELIQRLQEENSKDYNTELTDLFNKTKSSVIRESILGFFSFQKFDGLKTFSLELVKDPYDYKTGTVTAVMEYISVIKLTEAAPAIRAILDSDNIEYRDRAIKTLGKIGGTEDASYLIKYLDGEIPGDDKQRLIIRQNVMTALGELKSVETWDRMAEIVQDKDENVMIRATAAVALGQMEKTEGVPILTSLFDNSDPVLRTAAIQGLSGFNTQDSQSVILESFKDSYYKVRLEAIAAAEKQNLTAAVPYIMYRAKTDPVDEVKFRAFKALGKLNDSSSNEWLTSLVKDEKTPDKIRVKATAVLLDSNFDSIFPDVEQIMLVTLKDDKKTWLRYELGKLVASTENSRSSSIASAYLAHKDTVTRSIGLDMYAKNKYLGVKKAVEDIAADEKQGALQRRAKKIIEE